MHLMHVLMRVSRLAKERQEQEPEHIKRCESSGDPTNGPEDFPVVGTVPGRGENHIFAEKTRQTGNAGDGERSNKECPKRPWHSMTQATHFAKVLNAAHPMNDT